MDGIDATMPAMRRIPNHPNEQIFMGGSFQIKENRANARQEYNAIRHGAGVYLRNGARGFDLEELLKGFDKSQKAGFSFSDFFENILNGSRNSDRVFHYSNVSNSTQHASGTSHTTSDVQAILEVPKSLAHTGGKATFQYNGRKKITVTIPANTTATVWVPARPDSRVTESGTKPAAERGVDFLRSQGNYQIYNIGSGSYSFESRL